MKDWRCLLGRHDWRLVKTADRDKYSECTRCGKHDWRRHLERTSTTYRGGGGNVAGGDSGGF
jgi:predicted nucleic acid-binding Zn ribbon protein